MFKRLMIYNPAKYNIKDEIDLFTFSTLAPPPGVAGVMKIIIVPQR